MEVREIQNKQEWENFLLLCQEKTFCHSWNWGEFNLLQGNKVWRFGVFDPGLLAVFQVIGIRARRGSFLFVPHGPVFLKEHEKKKDILGSVFNLLKQLGREEEAWFLRIAPLLLRTEENNQLFEYLGFINAPMHMHPEITWELDLTLSEEELLKNMRKTTRYLIRQAEKEEGVDVVKSTRKEDLEDFEQIYWETAKRHSFVPFSKEYLEAEFDVFSKDNQALMFSGKCNGEVLSSAMIIFHSQRAFYHQGASLPSKIPVSYLVQWEAIKEAKARGCQRYNFWGIVPQAEHYSSHPWKGLTLFKKGFGGSEKDYVKTKDYPLSWKYWLVFIFEQLRRRKRNL